MNEALSASQGDTNPDEILQSPTEVAANDASADEGASGLEALGYAPDVVGHGFADAPPADAGSPYAEVAETPAVELDEQGSAMQHLIDSTPSAMNLGDELNRPAKPDTGYQIPKEEAAVTTAVDINLNELTPPTPVDINLAELTPVTPVDVNLEVPAVLDVDLNKMEQDAETLRRLNATHATVDINPEVPEKLDIDLTEKAPEVKKELPPDILNAYQERFGINPEELKSIEGFETLSRGQQKQVLENLAQLTIGRIKEEAVEGHDKDIALEKANATKFGSKFLGKVWVGIRDSFTKKFDIVSREKKAAAEIEKGGMKEHEEVLKQMVKGMKNFGPAIKEGENGELEVQFIETEGMSPELAKVAEAFNEQGTKLSKIPYEWSLDTATKEQKEAFDKAKETYELQRDVMLNQMKKAGGKDGEAKAIAAMASTESTIEMQRFMQTCPDAAQELTRIEDQSAFKAALSNVWTERGLYMGMGAVGRLAITGLAGVATGPLIAMATAGVRGWKKTGDALVAQDAAQRRGEAPVETEDIKQAKARIAKINVDLANVDDERVKDQLKAELDQLNKSVRGTTQNMIESFNADDIAGDKEAQSGDRRRGATAKLEYLKAQIASIDEQLMSGPAADEAGNLAEKKAKLTAQLERRMNYTKMKLSEGKMVFGAEEERIGNQYALMRSMAEAEGVLATETASDANGDKAERRLAKMLNATAEEIKDARFNKKLKQAIKAGAIGGAFGAIGAGAADLYKYFHGGSAPATEWLADKISGTKGVGGASVGGAALFDPDAMSAATPKAEWIETPTGMNVLEEDLDVAHPSGTGLAEPDQYADVNGLDLPPDYKFPTPADPDAGLSHDLPPDYKFPAESGKEWVETPSGMRALQEDMGAAHPSGTGLEEPSASIETAPRYTVVPGDNLSKIFAREIPGSTNPEVIRVLKGMSPAQLKELGVSSGNPDLIYPNDKIDISKMRELLAARSATPSGVPSTTEYVDGSRGLTQNVAPVETPAPAAVETPSPEELKNIAQRQSMNNDAGVNPTGTAGIRGAAGTPSGETMTHGAPQEALVGRVNITPEQVRKLSVDEVMKSNTSNANLEDMRHRLADIQGRSFAPKAGEPVGDYLSRYENYTNRFGGNSAALQEAVNDEPFWSQAKGMTVEELKQNSQLNGASLAKLNGTLDMIQSKGFKPLPGETAQNFLTRYERSFLATNTTTEVVRPSPAAVRAFPEARGGVQALNETAPLNPAQTAREAQAVMDFDPEGMDKVAPTRVAAAPSAIGTQAAGAVRQVAQGTNNATIKGAADIFAGQQAGKGLAGSAGEVIAANTSNPGLRAAGEFLKKIQRN